MTAEAAGEGEVDEAYWATATAAAAHNQPQPPPHPMDSDEAGVQGDYDANFFADDNLPLPPGAADFGDEDENMPFADAREAFSPEADGMAGVEAPVGGGIDGMVVGGSQGSQEGAFGAQLVMQARRSRPEYVQYARVAKRVDMRRLKEEMWRGIGFGMGEEVRVTLFLSFQTRSLHLATLFMLLRTVDRVSYGEDHDSSRPYIAHGKEGDLTYDHRSQRTEDPI